MDEPTSSLQREEVDRLFALIRRLAAGGGLAVIYISHFLEEVREIADRFTVLRDGRTVGAGSVAATPVDAIIEMMVGRKLGELYPRAGRTPGPVVMRVLSLAGTPRPSSATFEI